MREAIFNSLKSTFGFDAFRPMQFEICESILTGIDTLAVLPTGSGKTLCFQLPAMMKKGMSIVITPLISLMIDQYKTALSRGIPAAYISHEMEYDEISNVICLIREGKIKLLYISPERMLNETFLNLISRTEIGLLIIDEAHCVEWGMDFRPAYLELSGVLNSDRFKGITKAAFTASATIETQLNIVKKFWLNEPRIIRASVNRENLRYTVIQKYGSGMNDIHEYIRMNSMQKKKGIIYRTTRRAVEDTARFLKVQGIDCLPYHAGLDPATKNSTHDQFASGVVKWICATIAYGMGIDISDIRYILHGDLSKTVEGYYQETGRAGRDGERAECILFYSPDDLNVLKKFIAKIEEKEAREYFLKKLEAMRLYAVRDACRRKMIMDYFGEQNQIENCGSCDVCLPGYVPNRFSIKQFNKPIFERGEL